VQAIAVTKCLLAESLLTGPGKFTLHCRTLIGTAFSFSQHAEMDSPWLFDQNFL
jgi:hypothetical protein